MKKAVTPLFLLCCLYFANAQPFSGLNQNVIRLIKNKNTQDVQIFNVVLDNSAYNKPEMQPAEQVLDNFQIIRYKCYQDAVRDSVYEPDPTKHGQAVIEFADNIRFPEVFLIQKGEKEFYIQINSINVTDISDFNILYLGSLPSTSGYYVITGDEKDSYKISGIRHGQQFRNSRKTVDLTPANWNNSKMPFNISDTQQLKQKLICLYTIALQFKFYSNNSFGGSLYSLNAIIKNWSKKQNISLDELFIKYPQGLPDSVVQRLNYSSRNSPEKLYGFYYRKALELLIDNGKENYTKIIELLNKNKGMLEDEVLDSFLRSNNIDIDKLKAEKKLFDERVNTIKNNCR